MIRLKLHVGKMVVEVEGETQQEVLAQAAFFADLPSECPCCSHPLRPFLRRPQGFEFYGLVCSGPQPHESNFGVRRDGSGLYYKGPGSFRAWAGRDDEEEEPTPPREEPARGRVGEGARGGGARGSDATCQRTAPELRDRRGKEIPVHPASDLICTGPDCGKAINERQRIVSLQAFGAVLCPQCQKARAAAANQQRTGRTRPGDRPV